MKSKPKTQIAYTISSLEDIASLPPEHLVKFMMEFPSMISMVRRSIPTLLAMRQQGLEPEVEHHWICDPNESLDIEHAEEIELALLRLIKQSEENPPTMNSVFMEGMSIH